jgi:asparagine synthase (glutamine-hydrolysing)
MCGIAGFLDRRAGLGPDELRRRVGAMSKRLAHRGPDGHGAWVDPETGVAFGHRRLAIIDLSARGDQPMVSADGSIVLTYNGELYNYRELRELLAADGHRFRGESDSEILTEAIAAWGVERALQRANGMFAFAAWDRKRRILTLARDRLGIKPLYWATLEGVFLFGSEIKALAAHPAWRAPIDREAVAAFLAYGNVPAPRTIYAGVRKLEPGTMLIVGASDEPRIQRYWDAAAVALAGAGAPLDLSLDAAADRVEALLTDAVRLQMVADVPLGAFLSGGIDSSLVVALMQKVRAGSARTFTIGFAEASHDESQDAARVARHLGSDHEDVVLSASEALSAVPQLAEIFDEPFADSSQIPALLLSRMTRRHVTVALSGDGGDELFAGYNRHRFAASRSAIRATPGYARHGAASLLTLMSPAAWDRLGRLLPRTHRPPQLGDKLHKLAGVLTASTEAEVYRRLTAGASRGRAGTEPDALGAQVPFDLLSRLDPVSIMQYLDLTWYLPNDVLTKVDRASMAVGLEVRVPLLDHRLVELSWRLPASLKLGRGGGKLVLRRILDRYVPRHLTARPKSGFAVPIGNWLRGPLRGWAEEFLRARTLQDEGFVDPVALAALWAEHLSGRANHEHFLWNVLMLSSWLVHRSSTTALAAQHA